MTKGLRLNFDNLPLVEAAVRASLTSPIELSYSLVYAVRERLKDGFPALIEPKQIEVAPGTVINSVEFGPGHLPGAVFTGGNSGISVSLHPHVIVARWVKEQVLAPPPYPRFEALRTSLWSTVEAVRAAAEGQPSSISVMNMSYVNFITPPSPPASVRHYLSESAWLGAMSEARQIRKLEGAWSDDEVLDVRFALEQVTARLSDRVSEGYRLTTAAGLRLAPSVEPAQGLERVHDRLQSFFWSLISERAKTDWQGREA